MKDIIWLSPSLASGAIAARLVVFFERPLQWASRSKICARGTPSPMTGAGPSGVMVE